MASVLAMHIFFRPLSHFVIEFLFSVAASVGLLF
jgi:hypothetical protein